MRICAASTPSSTPAGKSGSSLLALACCQANVSTACATGHEEKVAKASTRRGSSRCISVRSGENVMTGAAALSFRKRKEACDAAVPIKSLPVT